MMPTITSGFESEPVKASLAAAAVTCVGDAPVVGAAPVVGEVDVGGVDVGGVVVGGVVVGGVVVGGGYDPAPAGTAHKAIAAAITPRLIKTADTFRTLSSDRSVARYTPRRLPGAS
jgi:hypothetical protein